MDIEGYEWEVLRSLVKQNEHLPRQIAMEFHYHAMHNPGLAWAGEEDRCSTRKCITLSYSCVTERDKTFAEIAAFIDFLWRFGSYYVIDRRDNE